MTGVPHSNSPSSALSATFNNLPSRSWSKILVQRLTTTCAHPYQVITRPITDHHFITSCLRANMEHIDEGEAQQTFTLTACPPPLSLKPSNPSQKLYSFPTCDMPDQPRSARFQNLLESAVKAYEKKEGVTLAGSEDSLAKGLQGCRSADEIAILLQGQAQAIDNLQQRDRIFKSIKIIVSILSPISFGASVADNVGLVRRKVRMACFTSL